MRVDFGHPCPESYVVIQITAEASPNGLNCPPSGGYRGNTMTTQISSMEVIQDFLSQKRIAMIGISRDPKSFSVLLFEELCRRGYDVVPVNPRTPNVLGRPCFGRVQDIQPPVDGALVMTSAARTDVVVADCAEAGVRRIWMYRAAGQGAVSQKAVEFCKQHGMQVIPGECPFMFLSPASGIHRVHGVFRKITGRYPRRARSG
jgi:uncharacterized protein